MGTKCSVLPAGAWLDTEGEATVWFSNSSCEQPRTGRSRKLGVTAQPGSPTRALPSVARIGLGAAQHRAAGGSAPGGPSSQVTIFPAASGPFPPPAHTCVLVPGPRFRPFSPRPQRRREEGPGALGEEPLPLAHCPLAGTFSRAWHSGVGTAGHDSALAPPQPTRERCPVRSPPASRRQ